MCVVQEFCEDCPEQSKLVRRNAAYKDNGVLPVQVALRTGDYIYDGLKNGFRVSSLGRDCFAFSYSTFLFCSGRHLAYQLYCMHILWSAFCLCVIRNEGCTGSCIVSLARKLKITAEEEP